MLSLVIENVCCQAIVPANVRASMTIESLSEKSILRPINIGIYGIEVPPGSIVGDPYLNQEWRSANLLLYKQDKVIINVPVRLDVYNFGLEVKTNEGIRFIDGAMVKNFECRDLPERESKLYINTKEYSSMQPHLSGFFEILSEGKQQLLKLTVVRIKKPDYNVALNVGSRDTKIYKVTNYYLANESGLYKLPVSRNKTVKMLTNQGFPETLLTSYTGHETDLKLVFDSFNSRQ
jgi:hypothetical protein